MDERELIDLEKLCEQATPGPWFVRELDDSHHMNLVAVSTVQDRAHLPWPDYGPETIVAATLVQEPRYVDHAAERWNEDAALMAAARTALPKLLSEVRSLRAKEQPSYMALKALMSHAHSGLSEEGFKLLRDRAAEFSENLIADFEDGNHEPDRFGFLELIVAAKVPEALPVLVGELRHPDPDFRRLAAEGLKELGTPEAMEALVKAGVEPSLDPWEQDIPQSPSS